MVTSADADREEDVMPRGAATFKEADAARLVRAVLKAGCKIRRVETDKNGRITVITDENDRPSHAEDVTDQI